MWHKGLKFLHQLCENCHIFVQGFLNLYLTLHYGMLITFVGILMDAKMCKDLFYSSMKVHSKMQIFSKFESQSNYTLMQDDNGDW